MGHNSIRFLTSACAREDQKTAVQTEFSAKLVSTNCSYTCLNISLISVSFGSVVKGVRLTEQKISGGKQVQMPPPPKDKNGNKAKGPMDCNPNCSVLA